MEEHGLVVGEVESTMSRISLHVYCLFGRQRGRPDEWLHGTCKENSRHRREASTARVAEASRGAYSKLGMQDTRRAMTRSRQEFPPEVCLHLRPPRPSAWAHFGYEMQLCSRRERSHKTWMR
ncbi:hypothetical protein IG631_07033 [Alternaria alternata]|nr:hypothetical protein IG631_07033 [Alternaria alternata]